jgi:hypothetical protein
MGEGMEVGKVTLMTAGVCEAGESGSVCGKEC